MKNMTLINSWWFDFERMEAHRDINWLLSYYKKTRTRYMIYKRLARSVDFLVREDGTVYRWSKDDSKWVEFFSPPECQYNNKVWWTYRDWLFVKQLESQLLSK